MGVEHLVLDSLNQKPGIQLFNIMTLKHVLSQLFSLYTQTITISTTTWCVSAIMGISLQIQHTYSIAPPPILERGTAIAPMLQFSKQSQRDSQDQSK